MNMLPQKGQVYICRDNDLAYDHYAVVLSICELDPVLFDNVCPVRCRLYIDRRNKPHTDQMLKVTRVVEENQSLNRWGVNGIYQPAPPHITPEVLRVIYEL